MARDMRKRRVRDELRELRHDLLYGVRDPERALGVMRHYNAEHGSLLTPEEVEHLLREPSRNGAEPQERREPLSVDFDEPPKPPRWRVQDLIECGTLVVLSGDTGAAKSICAKALAVAAVTGGRWVGHKVRPCRVVFVDEENPRTLVHARLRALGMTNEHRGFLRYFNRVGVMLEPHGGVDIEWLESEVTALKAKLVFIDSASAATSAEVTDNTEVAALMKQLRGVASRTGATVVLLHHERKQQPGQTRDRSQAMLGARQWAAQADTHITIAVAGPFIERPSDNGESNTERTFTLSRPKVRSGGIDEPRKVVVTSVRDSAGRLLEMRVEDRGALRASEPEHIKLAREVAHVVLEMRRASPAVVAETVGRDRDDGTLKRAIAHAIDQEWIEAKGKTTGRNYVPGASIEGADDDAL